MCHNMFKSTRMKGGSSRDMTLRCLSVKMQGEADWYMCHKIHASKDGGWQKGEGLLRRRARWCRTPTSACATQGW